MSTLGMLVNIRGRSLDIAHIVEIDYTNWRGERRTRFIAPTTLVNASSYAGIPAVFHMTFEATPHHEIAQFMVRAFDLEKGAERTFAMADIHSWRSVPEKEVWPVLKRINADARENGWSGKGIDK